MSEPALDHSEAPLPMPRSCGVHLPKFSWTPIVRHTLVKGTSPPDDPTLASYWANRRRRVTPHLTATRCACSQAGRALPAVRGTPAHRRTATTISRTMGTVVATRHPARDRQRLLGAPQATRPTGRKPDPPGPGFLPASAPRPPLQDPAQQPGQRPAGLTPQPDESCGWGLRSEQCGDSLFRYGPPLAVGGLAACPTGAGDDVIAYCC